MSDPKESEDAAAVLLVVNRLLKLLVEKAVISGHEATIVAQGGGNLLKGRLTALDDIISQDGNG